MENENEKKKSEKNADWVSALLALVVLGVGYAGKKFFDARKRKRIRNKILFSPQAFAHELVNSEEIFDELEEIDEETSNALTNEDIERIKNAVAQEVINKLKADPDFKKILARDVKSLRQIMFTNLLAKAVVEGIMKALSALGVAL